MRVASPDAAPAAPSSSDPVAGAAAIYRFAAGVELVEARSGPALLGWSPLRLVTVNPALAKLLRAGPELVARSPAAERALDALRRRGLVVREPRPEASARLPSVTVVVPVKDRADELRRCLASIDRLQYPRDRLEVVVVDDGSVDATPAVARAHGARVLPSGGRGRGPAAARNVGAAAARGEILAFLDSDCVASERWLAELAPAFEDGSLVAIGGRVDGLRSASALDRYEAAMSSLCLGPRALSGQAGSDTFYLPSCNLLVRRSAFAAAGGFDAGLRVAEDVDLTWRLRDRGGAIAYVPRGGVRHEHRNHLASFAARRFDYGTSEGPLQVLHPGRRKRIVLPPVLVAAAVLVVASLLARSPVAAIAGAAAIVLDGVRLWARLRRELAPLPLFRVVRARARAFGSLAYWVSLHLARYHAAALLVAAIAWPRFAPVAAVAFLWPAWADHRLRRPALAFPWFLAFHVAEHLAYGAGVLWGCLRGRSFRCYRPLFVRDGP